MDTQWFHVYVHLSLPSVSTLLLYTVLLFKRNGPYATMAVTGVHAYSLLHVNCQIARSRNVRKQVAAQHLLPLLFCTDLS